MEHIDVSKQSLAAQEAEIYRFVIRTTDLKDPVYDVYSHISVAGSAKKTMHKFITFR